MIKDGSNEGIQHTHAHSTHADLLAVGFDDIGTTAVAFIEVAATIVVRVVAVTIADVVRERALLLTLLLIWVFRILALAFFAVGCFDTSTLD